MDTQWNQKMLQDLIIDKIEESLRLEYKGAGDLGKNNDKKASITKDVSALANSSGGTIIYGIREYKENDKSHQPEKLDPVDRTLFSKEWLEQVINTIQPRIEGIVIHPVSLDTDPNDVVYVVEVPQGTTAHQARDHRYYKRFNFESQPMEDYEIRDVMNRATRVEVNVKISLSHAYIGEDDLEGYSVEFLIGNVGKRRVRHLKVVITLNDNSLLNDYEDIQAEDIEIAGLATFQVWDDKVIECTYRPHATQITFSPTSVLFPGEEIDVGKKVYWAYYGGGYRGEFPNENAWREYAKKQRWGIEWILYADDMPPKRGQVYVADLPIKESWP